VGLGLNGRNRVPAGAIGVASALGRRSAASAVPALAARVLAALEWAVWASDRRELVRTLAERRLLIPPQGILHQGRIWQAEGLSGEGALLLRRPGERVVLTRTF
jgi:BirA family biotin operon repressor/biotin-[acetyl-CoA-carboxylase] ligase